MCVCASAWDSLTGPIQMPQRHAANAKSNGKHNAKHNVLIIIIDNKLNCQHFSAKYRFRWIIVALSARHTDRNYVMVVNLICCISFYLSSIGFWREKEKKITHDLCIVFRISFARFHFPSPVLPIPIRWIYFVCDQIITNKTKPRL